MVVAELIVADGAGETATEVTAMSEQPLAFVTVTVYEVLAFGETEMVFDVAPVFHK